MNKSKSRLIIIVTPNSCSHVRSCSRRRTNSLGRGRSENIRENTTQEGESYRLAHRSLGAYASPVQGVVAFTASNVHSQNFIKISFISSETRELVIASSYLEEILNSRMQERA